jgi:hypothetical protein
MITHSCLEALIIKGIEYQSSEFDLGARLVKKTGKGLAYIASLVSFVFPFSVPFSWLLFPTL